MLKPTIITLTIVAVLLGAVSLRAHDSFRIIGNITSLTDTELSVKNKDSKTFVIALSKATYVWRGKKKVPSTELKVGLSVVVDAMGDSALDLEAQDITIVPPLKFSK
jgi:co-chaperonin GroES (HSP10)